MSCSWKTNKPESGEREFRSLRRFTVGVGGGRRDGEENCGNSYTWPRFTNLNWVSQSKTKQAIAQGFKFPSQHRSCSSNPH